MDDITFDLTLEQEFEYRCMKDASDKLSREQATELLLQGTRLLMIKNNILSSKDTYSADNLNNVNNTLKLTLEQEFNLQSLQLKCDTMKTKDIVSQLLNTLQSMMAKDNLIKEALIVECSGFD